LGIAQAEDKWGWLGKRIGSCHRRPGWTKAGCQSGTESHLARRSRNQDRISKQQDP